MTEARTCKALSSSLPPTGTSPANITTLHMNPFDDRSTKHKGSGYCYSSVNSQDSYYKPPEWILPEKTGKGWNTMEQNSMGTSWSQWGNWQKLSHLAALFLPALSFNKKPHSTFFQRKGALAIILAVLPCNFCITTISFWDEQPKTVHNAIRMTFIF